MKTTNAESFAVASTAGPEQLQLKRLGLRSSQRLNDGEKIAPLAPIAPPSVGVATPMKMVPSTRKIRKSGGTMTKVTCCASNDRNRNPVTLQKIQFNTAAENANSDRNRHDQNDEIGAAIGLIAHHQIPDRAERSEYGKDSHRVSRPVSRKPTASGGRPGAASRESLVTTKTYNA